MSASSARALLAAALVVALWPACEASLGTSGCNDGPAVGDVGGASGALLVEQDGLLEHAGLLKPVVLLCGNLQQQREMMQTQHIMSRAPVLTLMPGCW